MNKFINFLFNVSAVIHYTACILQDMNLHQEYYVYVPSRNKPYYKHRFYIQAEREAERIANQCLLNEEIEVLRIAKRIWGKKDDVPF